MFGTGPNMTERAEGVPAITATGFLPWPSASPPAAFPLPQPASRPLSRPPRACPEDLPTLAPKQPDQ